MFKPNVFGCMPSSGLKNIYITVPKLFTCLVITVEPYSQLLNMVISLLRSLFLVPVKRPYIFL